MKQFHQEKEKNVFPKILSLPDPIIGLYNRFFKGKSVQCAIVIGIVQLSTWFLVDRVTFSIFPNEQFTGINDLDEMLFGFFGWGIFTPLIWFYYLTCSKKLKETVDSLYENGVVRGKELKKKIQQQEQISFSVISALITIIVLFLYLIDSVNNEIASGRISFWFMTWWGKVIIGVIVGFAAYVLIIFVLKVLHTLYTFFTFFTKSSLKKVYTVHVDECGGLGAIGKLTMRITTLAVFVGMWAVWYSLLPWLVGGQINMSSTVILLYSVYAVLVPLLLLTLLLPTHKAMKRYKDKKLSKLSKIIQENIKDIEVQINKKTSEDELNKSISLCQKNYEQYKLLLETPEWPIRTLSYRRFRRFALLPGLSGVLSWVVTTFDLLAIINRFMMNSVNILPPK